MKAENFLDISYGDKSEFWFAFIGQKRLRKNHPHNDYENSPDISQSLVLHLHNNFLTKKI